MKAPFLITTLFIPTLIISLGISTAQAGKLDSLESESTQSKSRSSSSSSNNNSSSSSSSSDDSIGGAIAGAVAEVMVEVIVSLVKVGVEGMAYTGDNSMERYQRDEPDRIDPIELKNAQELVAINQMSKIEYTEFQQVDYKSTLFRTLGDPILPTVKLSSQWLAGSDDINAQLYRIEAGYGLIGMSYSQNKLQENGDSLILSNFLVHYRMSFGNDFSWDLAYGRGKMNGNQEHDGSVFSMPIRYRYHKDWHFEYQPIWSNYEGGSLSEHQFSFNYHYKHIGATVGYKTWSAGTTSVDGLFTGLYLSF
jgi:hypothetical protein